MQSKQWWWVLAAVAAIAATAHASLAPPADLWQDHEHEVLVRYERATNNKEGCRYVRGAWSECEAGSNVRTRTLTLKKGDPATCDRVKTIHKKCKKACRYEKSSWSECSAAGEMYRTDPLKPNSDPACEPSRRVTKKCNKNKPSKAAKDKGHRGRQ